ncbi:YncE family protein [Mucilaginibacter sp. dw_454]|uniref:YncE family protein n=1 Tax=Mucilaginibacter sp. dw_454 TaxID=2720079 RepID=UPI001BD62EAB|nr:YncE family protein [Mucilaginibacter sp. dw_454]
MKQFKLHSFLVALASITLLASCHKDKVTPAPSKPTAERAGIYVLNQGGIGHNNSTLTYYDYTSKSLVPDQFAAANAPGTLGDTGNDLGIYGSKMYIVVNNSDAIYITTAKTAKQLSKITLHQPRSVVFDKNHAFVTSYDGTVSVIDTTSMTITKTITVGADPEQMAIANGKLYVANSGGLLYPDPPTNTLSVIDLATLTEIKKITVQINPIAVTADAYNNVYVLSLGDFDTKPAGLTIVDATTDAVKSEPTVSLGYNIPIYTQGDFVYYPTTTDNKTYQIAVYNAKTQSSASVNFITDGTSITTPFSISGDPLTGEIFIGDAKDYASNGTLTAFDKTGKKEYAIATGISPGKIVLLNK